MDLAVGGLVFDLDDTLFDFRGAFGMRTAWVRRGRQFPADLHPPDHVVESVRELGQIL